MQELEKIAESIPARTRPTHLWKKGQSGNPSGKAKGTKNKITVLKLELEAAVRDNIKSTDIKKVLNKMVKMALEGNVGAGKLILDKFITNATESDAPAIDGGTFVFQVKNLTLKTDDPEQNIIDVTPTEET